MFQDITIVPQDFDADKSTSQIEIGHQWSELVLFLFLEEKNSDSSDDENEKIENSTTIVDENHRFPPTLTWKCEWSFDKRQQALSTSPFANRPSEILIRIFQFLSVHDLGNVSLVCRHFQVISDQDETWWPKCNRKCHPLSSFSVQKAIVFCSLRWDSIEILQRNLSELDLWEISTWLTTDKSEQKIFENWQI